MILLPKRNIIWLDGNIKIEKRSKDLNVYINDSIITKDLFNILGDKKINKIRITVNSSLNILNTILTQLSNHIIKKNIEIFLGEKVKVNNNSLIRIDELPENVKIDFFSHCAADTRELSNWCLNLNDADFKKMIRVTNNHEMASKLIEERQISKNIFLMLSKHVNFNLMSDTEKMNYMFEYVAKNFAYDYGLIGPDGNYKPGVDTLLGSDPINVFNNRKGVCTGRSGLLTILLNNPYMKVKCYNARGKSGNLQHEWNEFIDEHGNVYTYDLSYNIKHINSTNHDHFHKLEERSHIVEQQLRNNANNSNQSQSSSAEPRPLPPRRNSNHSQQVTRKRAFVPLPPRKKL